MVTNAVRCTDPLPKHFSDLDVAKLLQAKGILSVPTGLKEGLSRLVAERGRRGGGGADGRSWSDEENAEADAENKSAAFASNGGGFNLLGGDLTSSSSGAAASSGSQRVGGSKLQKGQFRSRRAADSGSESD